MFTNKSIIIIHSFISCWNKSKWVVASCVGWEKWNIPTIFNYLPLPKFPKVTFNGLGSKYRICLDLLPGWTLPKQRWLNVTFAERWLRRGDMEFWVHQKTVLDRFKIRLSTYIQPPRFSIVGLKAQLTKKHFRPNHS